jgi:hypothetical protein
MTFGPAMSGALLDAPSAGPVSAELVQVQRVIVDKLDAILSELRAANRG